MSPKTDIDSHRGGDIELTTFARMYKLNLHRELTLAATLHHCNRRSIRTPQWAISAMTEILCPMTKVGKRRGPSARRTYVNAMVKYARWDLMDEAMEARRSIKKEIKQLRRRHSTSKLKSTLNERKAKLEEAGIDWNDALQWVSSRLAGSKAGGSPETIKKSYFEVKRSGERGLFYYSFERPFLRSIGIDIDFENQGKKLR